MHQPIFLKILRFIVVMTHSYKKCYNDCQIIYKDDGNNVYCIYTNPEIKGASKL